MQFNVNKIHLFDQIFEVGHLSFRLWPRKTQHLENQFFGCMWYSEKWWTKREAG